MIGGTSGRSANKKISIQKRTCYMHNFSPKHERLALFCFEPLADVIETFDRKIPSNEGEALVKGIIRLLNGASNTAEPEPPQQLRKPTIHSSRTTKPKTAKCVLYGGRRGLAAALQEKKGE
jgi:hypothetical protein